MARPAPGEELVDEASAALLSEMEELYAQLEEVRARRDDPSSSATGPRDEARKAGADGAAGGARPGGRVLLVTYRLPFQVERVDEAGGWRAEPLRRVAVSHDARAFAALHGSSKGCMWVGAPLCDAEPGGEQAALRARLMAERYCPVFVEPRMWSLYYDDFVRAVLWPTCHSLPMSSELHLRVHEEGEDAAEAWEAYRAVNQLFADAVADLVQEGDVVFVQGHQLMLVPAIVRSLRPGVPIGWYSHTPFPSSELFRVLTMREELVMGVLGADAVFFQVYDYASHFIKVCLGLLGLPASPTHVTVGDRRVSVCVVPVGAVPAAFHSTVQLAATQHEIAGLRSRYAGQAVILGVDSADEVTGVRLKLQAFELLLSRHPALRERVVLVQVYVPRLTHDAEADEELDASIHELVGRISGRYARVGEAAGGPLSFLNSDVSFSSLCALYAVADVLLLTPIRDGNNLVPVEYVLAREAVGRDASVVVSEFAGCVRYLRGARSINPFDLASTAATVVETLRCNGDERSERHKSMLKFAKQHTARKWASVCVAQLRRTAVLAEASPSQTGGGTRPVPLDLSDVARSFTTSRRRVLVLEYDGALVGFHSLPELSGLEADRADALGAALETLCRDESSVVVVLSGRTREVLHSWVGNLDCVLVAEGGAFVRWEREAEWELLAAASAHDKAAAAGHKHWKADLMPVLHHFAIRTPGVVVEENELALAWHCGLVEPHFVQRARDLLAVLDSLTRGLDLEVVAEPDKVEVRAASISKAQAIECVLQRLEVTAHPSEADHADQPPAIDLVLCLVRGASRADNELIEMLHQMSRASAEASLVTPHAPAGAPGTEGFRPRGRSNSASSVDIADPASVATAEAASNALRVISASMGQARSRAAFAVDTEDQCLNLLQTLAGLSARPLGSDGDDGGIRGRDRVPTFVGDASEGDGVPP